MQIRGIIPPVITPMKSNEDIDFPRLRSFIDHLINEGVHGIFVLGTNSEFYALDEREKQEVFATAVEHVGGRTPVYAGTGAETTREVVRLTQIAEKEGVDGVSVITPYFIKPSQRELIAHFRRICESTSLPVLLYNNPGTCGGVKFDVETVAQLSEIPNVVGIKDSSGDLENTIRIIQCVPKDFSVMMGRDSMIYQALDAGAQGAVPATANIAPGLAVQIYEAMQKGDVATAKAAQRKLFPVRISLTYGTAPGGVKIALQMLGQSVGPCRSPVLPWTADQQAKMRVSLIEAGLLSK